MDVPLLCIQGDQGELPICKGVWTCDSESSACALERIVILVCNSVAEGSFFQCNSRAFLVVIHDRFMIWIVQFEKESS